MADADTRGHIDLTLDGRLFTLRPSYTAITAFERQTGKGLLGLARDAQAGELSLDDTAVIVTECVRAWGIEVDDLGARNAAPRKIAELIIESDGGLANVLGVLTVLLALAATGGMTSSGEVKAPAKTTTKKTPVGA